jgi:hypothetical protein
MDTSSGSNARKAALNSHQMVQKFRFNKINALDFHFCGRNFTLQMSQKVKGHVTWQR